MIFAFLQVRRVLFRRSKDLNLPYLGSLGCFPAAALAIAPGRDVQGMAALTLAISGDAARARVLADDLGKRFSSDTLVKSHWLPAIRAEIELKNGDPSQAIELLQERPPTSWASPCFLSTVGA